MPRLRTLALLLGVALLAPERTHAHHAPDPRPEAGSLVSVSVEVEGGSAPLFLAPDGSGRFYFEARPHARYALRLANHTHERLGVQVNVDGLNVISGQRGPGPWTPGRMYVLGPWDSMALSGWRTSLDEVRRFTFVDEARSYAARSGQANARMGWIEVAVYRERRPRHWEMAPLGREPGGYDERPEARDRADSAQPPAAEPPAAARPDAAPEEAEDRSGRHGTLKAPPRAEGPRSYPGTGWGAPAHDPAVVVDFDPQPRPAERLTLRYEYAAGLRALGIDLRPLWWARDRLRERDRGDGFARPPAW